jgi:hypothetical protein
VNRTQILTSAGRNPGLKFCVFYNNSSFTSLYYQFSLYPKFSDVDSKLKVRDLSRIYNSWNGQKKKHSLQIMCKGHKCVFKLKKCENVRKNFVIVLIRKFYKIQFGCAHFNSVSDFNFLFAAIEKHVNMNFSVSISL